VTSIYGRAISWNPAHALPNAPVQIFIWSESPDPADHQRAWATALVLMVFVFLTGMIARLLLARSRRRLG
jgi:ABC-type phosphate transport system permease subunit